MYCTQCGNNNPDNATNCITCGAPLQTANTQQPAYQQPAYQQPNYQQPNYQQPNYQQPNYQQNNYQQNNYQQNNYYQAPPATGSTWDGGVLDTFVTSLVASLMIVFTCYIATPWAICYLAKFITSHVMIDGKRYRFDGDGASLLGNWIVWLLLTVVTCGIYSFWVAPKMYKWIFSHVHQA